ncbi:MAG TPA: Mpo1-like protein [Solimonas sp.]|nr:Mpo1-like protein [Solimonas sp.]
MRSLKQFLDEYQKSHQNPVNAWIHYLCVPAIFFSTLALLWLIPVGRWLGLSAEVAPWVNPVTILAPLTALFYLRLSAGSLLAMALWFAASIAGILGIQAAGQSLLWIGVAVWLVSWAVQLVGHKIEGAKPSLADDLVFLLIGPLFVMHKLYRRAGMA